MPLNPNLAATVPPPVMEARRWLAEADDATRARLLNVSQAAPVDPPPLPLRQAIAEAALNQPGAHLYGPVLGNHDLREELAAVWARAYGGTINAANVAITQGCNQAFCTAIQTLAVAGDEVILPVPWYFNHKMWLDMQGIRAVPLPCRAGMVPHPEDAAALITERTRAIVLVTPNNPSGAEYPGATVAAFHDLARARGLTLILDETYRDFDSRTGPAGEAHGSPAHPLFQRPDWGRDVISLYSFSKAFRLTGHRVGAIIAAPALLAQVEKVLDTTAICASQLGQIGAVWGLRHLGPWLAGERDEILARRRAMEAAVAGLEGWQLRGCGAYFAWVAHPFVEASDSLARRMVREAGVLMLPGTMFTPEARAGGAVTGSGGAGGDRGGDAGGARHLRIAFANVDAAGIADLAGRLAALGGARR